MLLSLLCLATACHPQTSSGSQDASEPEDQIDREPELILDDRTQILRQVVLDIIDNPDPEAGPEELQIVFHPKPEVGIALIDWAWQVWPAQMPELLKPWKVQMIDSTNVPISNRPYLGITAEIVDLENKNPDRLAGNVCVAGYAMLERNVHQNGVVSIFTTALYEMKPENGGSNELFTSPIRCTNPVLSAEPKRMKILKIKVDHL